MQYEKGIKGNVLTLHMRCKICNFLDIIKYENGKNWKCPNCEFGFTTTIGENMAKVIRIFYVGNQYTDFANTTDEDYAKILQVLNNSEKSFILNNQWFNKENILTVIHVEVEDKAKEEPCEIYADIDGEPNEACCSPSRCC